MSAVPNPSKPTIEWPKQFKPHILMQGLLDTFELQQGTTEGMVPNCCFSCQQLGEKTAGTSRCKECDVIFCDRCAKMHKAMLGMGTHILTCLTGDSAVTQRRKMICKEHNSMVEFCCKDCNKAVCQKCCIVYHRKCHAVVTIESMSTEIKSFLQHKLKKLKLTVQDTKSILDRKQSQVDEMTASKVSVLSKIRQTSNEAIDLIKQKEKQLTDQLHDLTEQETGQLKGQMKSEELDLQMYQQYCDFIEQALTNDNPTDLYERYQILKSGSEEIQPSFAAFTPVSKISYQKKFDRQRFMRDVQLGLLTVSVDQPREKPKLCYSIDTAGSKDRSIPDPNDIIVIDVDDMETLVVTDSNNRNMKSFYTKKAKRVCSTITVDGVPFTVTQVKPKQVAMSFYSHERKFITVKVAPDLSLLTTVSTRKPYRSLTSISSTRLAAGSYHPPSIDIIDLSGTILRSLNEQFSLVSKPWYMSTTRRGHILVCDEGSVSVYCLTEDGDIVFTYKPSGERVLRRPLGVAATSSGEILVGDYDGNKVIQLTENGEFVRDMFAENVVHPQGLHSDQNMLYVAQEDTKVKVFDLCTDPKYEQQF